MTLLKTVITHVFGVLGRAFWPSLVIALLASFFYLYCTDSTDAGKGFWAAARGWVRYVRTSSFFRKISIWFNLSFDSIRHVFQNQQVAVVIN